MEESTEVAVAVIQTHFNEIVRRLGSIDDHLKTLNGRVGVLEKWIWRAAGSLAVITIGVAYLLK